MDHAARRLIGIGVLAVLVACGRAGGRYGDPVDGFACDASGREPIRARVSLHLVTPGGRVPATMGVGSTGSCNYAVRTEQEDGVVVVRGRDGVPTLDTFLTIWEYAIPQGSGGASEFREAAEEGEILVNSEAVALPADEVRLRDGDVIELIAP